MTVAMASVLELWRWPVKAMGGESLPSVRMDVRGVGGDRTHAVLRRGADGAWTTLRELGAWTAAYPFNIGANVDPASPPYAVPLDGGDELGEPGRTLEFGACGVRLRVLRACPRGGAYARVVGNGHLPVGARLQ